MDDYYEILGCNPDDDPKKLRKAWRKKCLENHPDQGGDEDLFMQIMHAYKMITDESYKTKQNGQPTRDLTFRIQIAVSFMEAFYGTRLVVGYNRIFLGPDFQPIKGMEVEPLSITFDLPPGSNDGFTFTSKGNGMQMADKRGKAHVSVLVEKHKRYEVKQIDVFAEDEVPLDLMLKGGDFVSETLWGHREIWIPAGTQPGAKIRIPGCGVNQKGFQYVTIKPKFPDQKDLKSSKWSGLGINWEKSQERQQQDEELIRKFEELKSKKGT